MRPPPPLTRFAGHPVVAPPVLIGGAFGLLACFTSGEPAGLMTGVIVLVALGRVLKANKEEMAYRDWQAAWDGMAGSTKPPSARWARPVGAVAGFALLAWLVAGADHAQLAMALRWMVLVGTIVGTVLLGRWLLGRSNMLPDRRSVTDAVRIAARPVMPVPPLAKAYAALPDYCRALLP